MTSEADGTYPFDGLLDDLLAEDARPKRRSTGQGGGRGRSSRDSHAPTSGEGGGGGRRRRRRRKKPDGGAPPGDGG
jgi:hypothetical protein